MTTLEFDCKCGTKLRPDGAPVCRCLQCRRTWIKTQHGDGFTVYQETRTTNAHQAIFFRCTCDARLEATDRLAVLCGKCDQLWVHKQIKRNRHGFELVQRAEAK